MLVRQSALAVLCTLVLTACAEDPPPDPSGSGRPAETGAVPGSLYGRVTTHGGAVYEGPLRWGGGEEALWTHTFNGVKDENPWAEYAPAAAGRAGTVLGVELPWAEPEGDLRRPFMARFGDIARIEARGEGVRGVIQDGADYNPTVRVMLKSGTAVDLDRIASSDFDDGLRVWDARRGVVDLGPREVRTVELMPGAPPPDAPDRLFGTVRTRGGQAFTGALQWDREASLGSDELVGRTDAGERRLRFDAVRALRRRPNGGVLVTTRDGGELALTGTRAVGPGNRGVYVDDPRYGRVLVSWEAFDRADFTWGQSGPTYDDFPPGRPLSGAVETRAGQRLGGRLVFDLDESETTETLDAPHRGVDYSIPLALVDSVDLRAEARGPARVTLRSGEALDLDRAGDLSDGNAGLLVFSEGRSRPEYVPWSAVRRVVFGPVE